MAEAASKMVLGVMAWKEDGKSILFGGGGLSSRCYFFKCLQVWCEVRVQRNQLDAETKVVGSFEEGGVDGKGCHLNMYTDSIHQSLQTVGH